ncbi:asparaginase [Dactylosporangium vinaceum]|uniref:Asparaginase n=1 Tax=Dactylosporangium vinaceum TaxID=53362 RepID=A0ABV5MAX7_9ACTN|nr:asparaginase [Dactylosporangium vinaceum]UAB98264.1 asparaginase [Dactylosporangium vinaceum]
MSGVLLLTTPTTRAEAPPSGVVVEESPAEIDWDTTQETMAAIARRVRRALGEEGFAGVVVPHGPDTLEATAYLTDLVAGRAAERGAIVFTTPGPGLRTAVRAAGDPRLHGVGAVACIGDELHAARWVRADADGFTSRPAPPLGRVSPAGVALTADPPPRPPAPQGHPDTNIGLLRVYPGIAAQLLMTLADAGARGIVLEGTGEGNVPVTLLATIADLVEWNIPVVVTSRTRAPRPPQPPNGLAARVGAVLAGNLSSAKALAALMVAVNHAAGVRDYFERLAAP